MSTFAKDKENRSSSFTRRAVILGGLQIGILGILGTRLAWLQVVEGQKYRTLAEQNRINVKLLAPERGEITDRFGVPLAINEQDFRVLILPEQTDDLEQALRKLSHYIELTPRDIQRTLKAAKRNARFVPVEIRNSLSREDISTIEVNLPDLPGILTDSGQKRSYPLREATAHLVGYVGAVTEENIEEEDNNPVLGLPGLRIGKSGIEKVYDKDLRGVAGQAEMEVNVVGREVRTLSEIKSTPGKRVILTVDGELQRFVQKRLDQERSAAAVIMDVHTGAVYAMASTPSFDPNYFVNGISVEHWEEIQANPSYPLNNKVMTGQYPPASTYKICVALAFLENNIATAHTTTNCPGYFLLGNDKFHCWQKHGHGRMNVISALEQSCDVYFYELSLKLGIDKISEMAARMGLGKPTRLESDHEKSGLLPTQAWKKEKLNDIWHRGETVVASIGQGYTLATPIQLAVMISRLVNGGYAVEPHLTAAIGSERILRPEFPSIGLNPDHVKLVIKGVEQVMVGARGTARGSQIPEESMRMGGKTGTAQVRRITKAQRAAGVRNEDLPWEERHHALFVGYAPINNPRYACSVVVEHGIGGSRSAAPLARDILWEAQKRAPALTDIPTSA
ncbi:MAG: penicillin-binding protein 2 [Rhodospirillales bacterium]|nr:penicillin-binding protein 2 [Rhodospirillales bacterium]